MESETAVNYKKSNLRKGNSNRHTNNVSRNTTTEHTECTTNYHSNYIRSSKVTDERATALSPNSSKRDESKILWSKETKVLEKIGQCKDCFNKVLFSFKSTKRNKIKKLKSDGIRTETNIKKLKISAVKGKKHKNELSSTLKLISYSSDNNIKANKINEKKVDFVRYNKTLKPKLKENVMRKVHVRKKTKIDKMINKPNQKLKKKPLEGKKVHLYPFIDPEEISEFTIDERRQGIRIPLVRERRTMPAGNPRPLISKQSVKFSN
ncbi:unnamed protein product [Moneuplotes crassus]|uniref:Uncharacterized protein n=1 Tax=Euplotes crassus TaxID=5936 RepID=A0AAD1XMR0_EUPCR|nr:unnamed protein product [Moneuplotes crassus]